MWVTKDAPFLYTKRGTHCFWRHARITRSVPPVARTGVLTHTATDGGDSRNTSSFDGMGLEFGVTAMSGEQTTLESLTERLISFRDERDWRQFHSLKDLIVSLNLEAAELLELIQWKSTDAVEQMTGTDSGKARLAEECADVLLYLLLISERTGINLAQAARDKIALNDLKYPVEKSRGNAAKYSEL